MTMHKSDERYTETDVSSLAAILIGLREPDAEFLACLLYGDLRLLYRTLYQDGKLDCIDLPYRGVQEWSYLSSLLEEGESLVFYAWHHADDTEEIIAVEYWRNKRKPNAPASSHVVNDVYLLGRGALYMADQEGRLFLTRGRLLPGQYNVQRQFIGATLR